MAIYLVGANLVWYVNYCNDDVGDVESDDESLGLEYQVEKDSKEAVDILSDDGLEEDVLDEYETANLPYVLGKHMRIPPGATPAMLKGRKCYFDLEVVARIPFSHITLWPPNH